MVWKNNLSLQSHINEMNLISNPQNNTNYCNICHSGWIEPVQINSTYPTNPIYSDPFPTMGGSESTVFIEQWLNNPIILVPSTVVEGPKEPINDVQKFLECLNMSQGAKLTIYVE